MFPCVDHPLLEAFDSLISFADSQPTKASLPVKAGRLGIHRVILLALPAFLVSAVLYCRASQTVGRDPQVGPGALPCGSRDCFQEIFRHLQKNYYGNNQRLSAHKYNATIILLELTANFLKLKRCY